MVYKSGLLQANFTMLVNPQEEHQHLNEEYVMLSAKFQTHNKTWHNKHSE